MHIKNNFLQFPIFIMAMLGICHNILSQKLDSFFLTTDKIAFSESITFRTPLDPRTILTGENIDVIYHKFKWNIDPNVYFISGSVQTNFRALSSLNSLTFDCDDALKVDSVFRNQKKLAYTQSNTKILTITLDNSVPTDAIDSVVVFYHGIPPSNGFGSFAQRFRDNVNKLHPELWTLSEPYGGRDWWPGKMDLNDKIDSVDILVTTPKKYRCGSNGILVSETLNPKDSTITYFWKHRYPIANYLVGITVTDYRQYFDTMPLSRKDTMLCLNYVYDEQYDAIKPYSYKIKYAMRLFDSLFAPYPFKKEKYGMMQFGWGGGQEHQTMSSITDLTNIELTDHELGHQWFGDKITCGSWHDIWLNESFATYCSGLYYENIEKNYWLPWRVNTLKNATNQPNGSVYVDDTTSVGRIFSSQLSYYKGARVLHYLRYVLGDSVFFKAVQNYITDPKLVYGFATTPQLIKHFEAVSGKDLTNFFKVWFYGEGYPSVTAQVEACPSEKGVYVFLSQTTSKPSSVKFFPLKLPLRIKSTNGLDTVIVVDYSDSTRRTFLIPIKGKIVNKIDTVIVDPEYWLLSNGNKTRYNLAADLCGTPTQDINNAIKINVYPNPGQTEVEFELPETTTLNTSVDVYNTVGQIVLHQKVGLDKIGVNKNHFKINLNGLNTGFYSLHMLIDNQNYFATFVKN